MDQITTSSDGFYKIEGSSKLEMRFTILNKRCNIIAKIKKLTKKELNLEYEDKGNTYFLKLPENYLKKMMILNHCKPITSNVLIFTKTTH
jgi:hypothetical protein